MLALEEAGFRVDYASHSPRLGTADELLDDIYGSPPGRDASAPSLPSAGHSIDTDTVIGQV